MYTAPTFSRDVRSHEKSEVVGVWIVWVDGADAHPHHRLDYLWCWKNSSIR